MPVTNGQIEFGRWRVRRQVQSLERCFIESRVQHDLRLLRRSRAGRGDRHVAAQKTGQRREGFHLRQIEGARLDRVAELIRRQVQLCFAGQRPGRRSDADIRRLHRSGGEDNVRRRHVDRLAVNRAITHRDGAAPFQPILRTADVKRAADVSGDRQRPKVEEFHDVGDRERLRGDVQIEVQISFSGRPGRRANQPKRAARLSDGEVAEGHLSFVWRAGHGEVSRPQAADGQFEIDDGHGAVDGIVCSVDGQVEPR